MLMTLNSFSFERPLRVSLQRDESWPSPQEDAQYSAIFSGKHVPSRGLREVRLWTLVGLIGLSGPVGAADPETGLRIAKRWCAECHVVTPDQTRAKADVPPFATIAKRKTIKELTIFLSDPHPKMPDMSLSRNEIADIVAYIKTLGSAPADLAPPLQPEQKGPDVPKHG
jgi:cytochrome c2